ncbi:hypothetical protein [Aeromonas encheleia]
MNTLLPDSAVARVMTATASYLNPEGRAISSPPAVAWKTSVDIGRCRTTLRHAEPPILLGYIASKVTINGEGVAGRRVVLLGRDLAIQGISFSDEQGNYRFDHLLLTNRYLVMAQDTFEFYYAPVAADLLTPTPYFK